MSTVSDAFAITRTLLGDDASVSWGDNVFIPKIVMAHNELLTKLVLNGIPVTYEETSLTTVDAGVTVLTSPTDLITPIKLNELGVNDTIDNAVPMTKTDFIPNLQQTEFLRYWAWVGNVIQLLGSTATRQVQLFYLRNIPAPSSSQDTLFYPLSENYYGCRVAAECVNTNPQRAAYFNALAATHLSSIVRTEVKRAQNLPVRRMPFSYQLRRMRRWQF